VLALGPERLRACDARLRFAAGGHRYFYGLAGSECPGIGETLWQPEPGRGRLDGAAYDAAEPRNVMHNLIRAEAEAFERAKLAQK